MAKQLYYYKIAPGDMDHLPAYHFEHGVVEAEPEEIEAILAAEGDRHDGLLSIKPVQEAAVRLEKFRADLGGALETYHSPDVSDDETCPEDAQFIDAYSLSFG